MCAYATGLLLLESVFFVRVYGFLSVNFHPRVVVLSICFSKNWFAWVYFAYRLNELAYIGCAREMRMNYPNEDNTQRFRI